MPKHNAGSGRPFGLLGAAAIDANQVLNENDVESLPELLELQPE